MPRGPHGFAIMIHGPQFATEDAERDEDHLGHEGQGEGEPPELSEHELNQAIEMCEVELKMLHALRTEIVSRQANGPSAGMSLAAAPTRQTARTIMRDEHYREQIARLAQRAQESALADQYNEALQLDREMQENWAAAVEYDREGDDENANFYAKEANAKAAELQQALA